MVEKENLIYLDHNATTRVDPEVFKAMRPYFCDLYGNPSSLHQLGSRVSQAIQRAREQVATFLWCRPDEIIFTSGGTESDNLAIRGVLSANPRKKHWITTRVEHSAVLNLCPKLEKEGYSVTLLDVDSKGEIDLDQLQNSISSDTALVSAMWANNETGVLYPVKEIVEICHGKGVLFHSDAVQAAGKVSINLQDTPVDLLSISGHKIYGPKGIGALFIRRGKRIQPQILGGGQERRLRGGTENVASIIGLAQACVLAGKRMPEDIPRIRQLRNRLEEGILSKIPDIQINGRPERRIANTSNICFGGVEGEAILIELDRQGICVSSGSACSSRSVEPSHVLTAMGLPETLARGAIRFSLGRENTEQEIDRVIQILPAIVEEFRSKRSGA